MSTEQRKLGTRKGKGWKMSRFAIGDIVELKSERLFNNGSYVAEVQYVSGKGYHLTTVCGSVNVGWVEGKHLALHTPSTFAPYPNPNDDPYRETVTEPPHYNRKGVECIAAIEASMSEEEFQGYLKGNVMKYMWRYKYKGKPVEDLKKAQWYQNKLILTLDNPTK